MQTSTNLGYGEWFAQVRKDLASINMGVEDWQKLWPFDFEREYKTGSSPSSTASNANRFWWFHQNRALKQECKISKNCWLPTGHQGGCEPVKKDTESPRTRK